MGLAPAAVVERRSPPPSHGISPRSLLLVVTCVVCLSPASCQASAPLVHETVVPLASCIGLSDVARPRGGHVLVDDAADFVRFNASNLSLPADYHLEYGDDGQQQHVMTEPGMSHAVWGTSVTIRLVGDRPNIFRNGRGAGTLCIDSYVQGSYEETAVALSDPIGYCDVLSGNARIVDPNGADKIFVVVDYLCLAEDEELLFVDGVGREIDSVKGCPGDFAGRSWALLGGSVSMRLTRLTAGGSCPEDNGKVRIGRYIPHYPFRTRNICDLDNTEDAVCYRDSHRHAYSYSMAVARMVMTPKSNANDFCTGFLIARNLLLTNEHCVDKQYWSSNQWVGDTNSIWHELLLTTTFEFDGEAETCGASDCGPGCPAGTKIVGASHNHADSSIGYALLTLNSDPNFDPAADFGFVDLDETVPLVNEEIYIPQHIHGREKRIAVHSDVAGPTCSVADTNCCSVKYFCDIDGGSSGAPILRRDTHLVVALHQGSLGCGNSGNFGSKMSRIYDQIKDIVDECDPDDATACDDGDPCTVDVCDGAPKRCSNRDFVDIVETEPGCCGNGVCNSNEDCASCAIDCCNNHELSGVSNSTTTFNKGFMFDIAAKLLDVDLTELWVRPHYSGYTKLAVYTKEGSWNQAGVWTLLKEDFVKITDFEDFLIPAAFVGRNRPLRVLAGSTRAIYVSSSKSRLEYTSKPGVHGDVQEQDSNIQLLLGASTSGEEPENNLSLSSGTKALNGKIGYHLIIPGLTDY